ncbi:MAG: MFS transporter [Thermoproteus sp. AZ2]|jgi:MFS family permease|uniref:MFS transporter n=1 Tax=Thermoproteus sp. AZ2 TaxID=1609232 RepID=A0ACC6UZL8_9CREN|nr:MAG: MFS transporter [Thermoproteus sp. AZ2]
MAREGLNSEVWKISFSAFFADLGYQGAIALLPLLLVEALKLPIYIYGIVEALNYGGGALMGLLGGYVADKHGRKRTALAGNALISLMSFAGLANSPILSPLLFLAGWWSRNFRTPARRAMLAEVTDEHNRKRAFGILHALDIGGGVASIAVMAALLLMGYGFAAAYLATLPFFITSTAVLASVNAGKRRGGEVPLRAPSLKVTALALASALFGFTYYSFGFPILSIFLHTGSDVVSISAYGLYLLVSALTGVVIGSAKSTGFKTLALAGYVLAAFGSLMFGLGGPLAVYLAASAILGLSMGVVETLEPFLVSRLSSEEQWGLSMGALTAGRSIGLFISNIAMGFLFSIGEFYAYLYAFAAAVASAVITLLVVAK